MHGLETKSFKYKPVVTGSNSISVFDLLSTMKILIYLQGVGEWRSRRIDKGVLLAKKMGQNERNWDVIFLSFLSDLNHHNYDWKIYISYDCKSPDNVWKDIYRLLLTN